ncbi:CDP-alcohol phosphatidyltransferase family protein [Mesorhizobium sp. CN2-181]|uniref:CDP-alcohol phosphatidyltransferase family protein n=1 Tax=Mesorhizobium yinganensis TaxID=3157707 RepID=UPI0032B82E18
MPTLYDLKPAFQGLLRPLTSSLANAGFTANQVTVAAAIMSVAAASLAAAFPTNRAIWLVIPVVLFLRMALNAIDGMLAREHGQASTLGMYLNELCDVASDLALILAFVAVPVFPAWGVVAFAITAITTEFAGALGIPAGIGRNYAGPFGKSDRAFALGLIAVLLAIGLPIGAIAPYIFPLLAVLSLLTIVNRVRAGLRPAP